MRERPIGDLVHALEQLGATVEPLSVSHLPTTVHPLWDKLIHRQTIYLPAD